MAESLGNPEKTALLALLLVGGEVTTPELKQGHGVELRKETRDKLNRAGLITSHTEKTPHRHRITAAGRTRCAELLVTGVQPTRPPALLTVVSELASVLASVLGRRDISLVDAVLEGQIDGAYQDLSVKAQDWVHLAQLRPKLNGAGKDEVDRVLLAMTRTGLVHLAPDSDRKALTDADDAAAIRIGSESKHLVAIEES
jgi:hypothetical protein